MINWSDLWEQLAGFLAGQATKHKLATLTNDPKALKGAVTTHIPLGTMYTVPGPPMGVRESRDMTHCSPELTRRYGLLKAAFKARTGRDLFETCTWRSGGAGGRQEELYRVGRRGIPGEKKLTNIDGITKQSYHNRYPSRAVDVCVDRDPGPGKVADWNPRAYDMLGPLCLEFGLVWGGTFKSFGPDGDYPHLELPPGVV